MAEEKKKPAGEKKESKPKGESKPKRKHLHQIVTTQAHDGTFSHEHIYKDKKEDMHHHPPVFAGTSSNMEDLHAHMDDHFGPQANQAEGGEPDGDEAEEGAGPATAEEAAEK